MKIWIVVGYPNYKDKNWDYAYCATREIAERELENAIKEDKHKDYTFEILSYDVITK